MVLLEILDEFDRICKKHGIQYFLDSGSALGAVRHSGFIPWDDDIDVGLIRSEYDTFIKIAESDLQDDFFLLTRKTDPSYHHFHAKLVKKGTLFPEPGTEKLKYRGVYIDIFPFDNTVKSRFMQRLQTKLCMAMRDSVGLKFSKRTSTLKQKLLFPLVSILSISFFEKMFSIFCSMFSFGNTKYVSCFTYKMLINRKLIFNREVMYPSKPIRFENRIFLIMQNPDSYLRTMYGDYLKLPPENERKSHFYGELEL